jgi:hypothetical protein
MKFIYLDSKYHEISISEVAYAQVEYIVMANRVCQRCSRFYEEDNPMVAENECLSCFLTQENNKHLSFIGKLSDSSSGYSTYQFLDPKGYIHLSYTASNRCEQSNFHTIKYWGFPVPLALTRGGKDIILNSSNWHIYSNFRQNKAIVIKYHEYYGDHLVVAFLVYKDGRIIELNKRKGDIQKLFKRARETLEETKDTQGAYHLGNDWTTYRLEDGHLYPVISDLASADYDKQAAR